MQEYIDHPLFWPVVIIVGIILVCFFAKFLFRVALAVLAIIVVWYLLAYLGFVPSPHNYFSENPIDTEQARELLTIDPASKRD